MGNEQEQLITSLEAAAERIHVLALNIAVAAAKMSYRQRLGPDVSGRLSQLVNQATTTVKRITQVLQAARSDRPPFDPLGEGENKIDPELARGIETALSSIIEDSHRIMAMLNKVKQSS